MDLTHFYVYISALEGTTAESIWLMLYLKRVKVSQALSLLVQEAHNVLRYSRPARTAWDLQCLRRWFLKICLHVAYRKWCICCPAAVVEMHLRSHCVQSVRSGRVFDSLRFLSVSIIRWLLSAICTQKTKVSPCRKAVQVFDVNYTPPHPLRWSCSVLQSAIQHSKDIYI